MESASSPHPRMCYRVGARLGVDVERWVSDEFLDVWLSSGVKKSKGHVEATLDCPINLMYNERRWQRNALCPPSGMEVPN